MIEFNITTPPANLHPSIKNKIDNKTKPSGALGQLENIAFKIANIQQSLSPQLIKPHVIVFAADHGIAEEGVSKFPQEVTYQMVLNFLNGGAAINTFCRQHNIELKIVDAGVKGNFSKFPQIIDSKIAKGTKNFLNRPAMSIAECENALEKGAVLIDKIVETGCNVIGFGEMGIANTSSASAIMHLTTGIPLVDCVGRGTGLDDNQLNKKINIIEQSIKNRWAETEMLKKDYLFPLVALSVFGGFEIAQMAGAMLRAAENKMLLLIDGFIATSALLIAESLYPNIIEYCIFSHQSDEAGHRNMLSYLKQKPILNIELRLGEGTGCALAYPLIASAVNFFNEMASFDEAAVSKK